VAGEVVELVPPGRFVFTYGFVTGQPIPPGGSRVTIRLEPRGAGTQLLLTHEFADPGVRDEHVQGWRYQLAVFGNVVADLANVDAADLVDAWFRAWTEPDTEVRTRELAKIAAPEVRVCDRFSLLEGTEDLSPHIAAAPHGSAGILPISYAYVELMGGDGLLRAT